MSVSTKKSKIVAFAVVVVLALNFGVVMPLLHAYQDLFPNKVPISVKRGLRECNFCRESYQ